MNPEEKKIALELAEKIQTEVSDLKDGTFIKALNNKINEMLVTSSKKVLGEKYSSNQRDRDMGFVDGISFVLEQIDFYSELDLGKVDLQKEKK